MNFEKNNDDENMLPKATVDKIVSGMLPKSSIVPRESKEIFQGICMKFLSVLTLEANKACEAEKKKTINHEHVYKALASLGFEEYVDKCSEEHGNYENYVKQKPSKIDKFKDSGLTLEELHDQQIKLFQNAKLQFERSFEEDHFNNGDE